MRKYWTNQDSNPSGQAPNHIGACPMSDILISNVLDSSASPTLWLATYISFGGLDPLPICSFPWQMLNGSGIFGLFPTCRKS